jgi:cell division protein DivIC
VKQIIPLLKNKFFLAILFLLVWLSFFDRYDFYTQYQAVQELKQLQKDKAYFQKEIDQNNGMIQALLSNPKKLEKFGRETYLMKKDNEDVFIIIDKSAKPPDDEVEKFAGQY